VNYQERAIGEQVRSFKKKNAVIFERTITAATFVSAATGAGVIQ
jgi:hypothetical protein